MLMLCSISRQTIGSPLRLSRPTQPSLPPGYVDDLRVYLLHAAAGLGSFCFAGLSAGNSENITVGVGYVGRELAATWRRPTFIG